MNYILSDKDLTTTSAILRVRGADANTYLQGQFTQDLKLAEKTSCYGLWLDQKGRALADSHIMRLADNDYRVVATTVTAPVLLARLEAYLIADEVEVQDETAMWGSILLWGDAVAALPATENEIHWPSRRAGPAARELLVPVGRMDAMVAALQSGAAPATRADAELARLRTGLPAVPVDIGPRDLPNEGGLDAVAISYTKGCYLGQEVMARLKNLGQVRRRLHLVRGAGPAPAPGTALHQGERKVGETRSAAVDGENFLALAMLSLVHLDPAAPLAHEPGGSGITLVRRV